MRVALYARVSTLDQQPEDQLAELRRHAAARGWQAAEYVNRGASGSEARRTALDALLRDTRRRRFDVLMCWRLDRLGRNLQHLVTLLDYLQALGVAFVSLSGGIDCTTPAGRLQLHILAVLADLKRRESRNGSELTSLGFEQTARAWAGRKPSCRLRGWRQPGRLADQQRTVQAPGAVEISGR